MALIWTRRELLAALIALALLAPQARAQNSGVVVYAAASLKDALDDVNAQYQQGGGKAAVISYAASSALAKQIGAGAPADIFISADLDWMDYLDQRHLIAASSRKNILGNTLVLVAPKDSTAHVTIAPGFPLASLLKGGRLAVADPAAVPAGKYAKAALEKLGVWDSVANSLAPTENVRAALLLVSRGETPYGIVYRTDAAAEPRVKIVGTFPADSHPPIIYPAVLIATSKNPEAAKYLAFIESTKAKLAFEKQGFTVLP
ncbi:MAG TPA: molybdate ABC transporter substrate-binding protein [Stellaceae bacterium]|jgi:molybdate transport system substrate-binding protein|nr:molybdate ABC transporter substrate-binding protein [Stellaceae bacterium]